MQPAPLRHTLPPGWDEHPEFKQSPRAAVREPRRGLRERLGVICAGRGRWQLSAERKTLVLGQRSQKHLPRDAFSARIAAEGQNLLLVGRRKSLAGTE